ncbi:hypothetical protein [Methylobacter sp. YRD-M1]|uniref:hypothetical protein n=1 Tax=Methylobacter sp. YRD-M1 TaxID=2911520 RepID=UPI00227C1DAC|nr:hypothetical protein [Methylobacter sp. YRD-M1]WAK00698.1 hypothetical protein LZ558_12665 [Methylobacter sp. YRD-M1]
MAEFKAAVLAEVMEAASVEVAEAASVAAIEVAVLEESTAADLVVATSGEIMVEAIEAAVSGGSIAADLAAAMEIFAEAVISGQGIKYIHLIITAVGDFTQATLFSGRTIIGRLIITGLTIQLPLIIPRQSLLLFT